MSKSYSQIAFELLRSRIINDEYHRGDKLNELSLVKELNMSRTPIREALKQLELEGLVETIPNKGVFVLGFTPRDIDDLFSIRIVLETLAISMAIERMTSYELDELRDVVVSMKEAVEKKDIEVVNALNIKYHDLIYQASQSSYLIQTLEDIHYYVSITSGHTIRKNERLESSQKEHEEIYQAILLKDQNLAKELITKHIQKTQNMVREYYKGS